MKFCLKKSLNSSRGKKFFRRSNNAKILPSSGQNGDRTTEHSSSSGSTTAGGVLLTGVNTYASSYARKTSMDLKHPVFTLDVRTANSRQVLLSSNLSFISYFIYSGTQMIYC